MNRKALLIALLTALCLMVWGQDKPAWKDRLFYGGSFGLSVGSITWIEVSPIVGYRLIPRVSAGIGGTYIYYKNNFYGTQGTGIYGGNIFATVVLIKNLGDMMNMQSSTNLFLHGELEFLSLDRSFFENPGPEATGRFMVNNMWVGPGIKQRIGERTGVYLMVLFNLNETVYSVYSNPTIRMGFVF